MKKIISILVVLLVLFMIRELIPNQPERTHQKQQQSISKPKPKEIAIEVIRENSSQAEAVESSRSKEVSGEFPPIQANYRRYLGFDRYARLIEKAGVRFFILDAQKNIYILNYRSEQLNRISFDEIKTMNFSPKTRMISDEPALTALINRLGKSHQLANYEVLMLFPQSVESQLTHSLQTALSEQRIDTTQLRGIKGYYKQANNRLVYVVQQVIDSKGKAKAVNQTSVQIGS